MHEINPFTNSDYNEVLPIRDNIIDQYGDIIIEWICRSDLNKREIKILFDRLNNSFVEHLNFRHKNN